MKKTKKLMDMRRDLATRILDRIVSDAGFRRQLVSNADRALRAAGFERDMKKIHALTATSCDPGCRKTCGYRSCDFSCLRTCYNTSRVLL